MFVARSEIWPLFHELSYKMRKGLRRGYARKVSGFDRIRL